MDTQYTTKLYIMVSGLIPVVGLPLPFFTKGGSSLLCFSMMIGLIFSSILGYYIFNEIPDIYTWIGAFIIFVGILIISFREMKLKKEIVSKNININS